MKLIYFFVIISIIGSCKTIDYPSIEESEKKIFDYKNKLSDIENKIKSKSITINSKNDLSVNINIDLVNRLLEKVANDKQEDLIIDFFKSPNVYKDDINLLGIKYTNFIDIDGGKISLNLKKFQLENLQNNQLGCILEIEGMGNIAVSGKYTGIPATASPNLQLYLNDKINFNLENDINGNMLIKPQHKSLVLKTKTIFKLLKWELPWSQDIQLETTKIIQPISFPLAIENEINLPIPAQNFGDNKIEFAPYKIKLSNTKVSTIDKKIEYNTRIDFIKK